MLLWETTLFSLLFYITFLFELEVQTGFQFFIDFSDSLQNGVYSIYAGVTASKAVEVYQLLLDEMQELLKNGLSKEEFTRAKEQLKGNYILGLESTNSRMNAIGRSMVMTGKVRTAEQTLEGIEKVTMDDVQQILPILFDREKLCGSAVGKIDENALRNVLA